MPVCLVLRRHSDTVINGLQVAFQHVLSRPSAGLPLIAAFLLVQFVVLAQAAAPPPSISNLVPGSYPASNNPQTMTVNGSNFQSGATLTFHDPQNNQYVRSTTFISSGQLTHQFNDASDVGTWTLFVTNPDGQSSNTVSFQVTQTAPPPSISNLVPGSYPASNNPQTMTVNGSNFQSGATLTFHDPQNNQYVRSTTFISGSQLTHQFNDASDVGTWTLFVTNPDGQSSNTVSFQVTQTAPPPSISNLVPGSYPASNNPQTMTVNGSNFQSGATLTFHDPQNNQYVRSTTFISSGQLTHQFNDASDVGTWTLFVTNPDGQSSNTVSFQVTQTAPPPSISNLVPGSYPASNNPQTMTVNGSNFQSGATLTFHDPQNNQYVRSTTFISSGQLTHQFNDASDVGTWTLFVTNPDGQSSNTVSFQVTQTAPPPSISNLVPGSYPASNNPQTMTVNGSNFQSGATLTFHDPQNNQYVRSTTFISSGQLTHQFNDASDVGTWTLFVTNPDGQSSNTVSFQVTQTAPPPSISNLVPGSYPASNNPQTMTVNGSNFQSGATLTFHDPQNNQYVRSTTFISSGQLTHQFNDASDVGTWTLFVTNPDGQSSNTVSFQVTTQTSETTLVSSPNPSDVNQQVTFAATVTGQYGGTPTGAVTFQQDRNILGTAQLVNAQATLTHTFSREGTLGTQAVYSGDSSYAGSTSNQLVQTVGHGAQPIALPVLFVQGWCADPQHGFDFQFTENNVQAFLQAAYPQLYQDSLQWWVFYDGRNVNFEIPSGDRNYSTFPATSRFFTVAFDDPSNLLVKYFDPVNVAQRVPMYAKGDELAHIIWRIKSITGAPRVIIVAHSMGGLVSRAYVEGLANGSSPDPYFQDISTLVTIDTPHGGSFLAEFGSLPFPLCYVEDTLNKREMYPTGQDSKISQLNYLSTGAVPLPTALSIYSIVSYWTRNIYTPLFFIDPLFRQTDNALYSSEQDLYYNLYEPGHNSQSNLFTVTNAFDGVFSSLGIYCGVEVAPDLGVLHSMRCTGAANQTIAQIESELQTPVVMTPDVIMSPSSATVERGGTVQFTATTPSGGAPIWTLLEGPTAGSITADGLYINGGFPGPFHAVAIDSVRSNHYGEATITVSP